MLSLELQQRLDRTYAWMQVLLGLACTVGLVPGALAVGRKDPVLLSLLVGSAFLVLVLTLGIAGLLGFAGQRIAQGRGRGLHTALAIMAVGSNPPLGTAYGLYTLWTCWSHPTASARLAGRQPPPADPTADDRATRYHRIAHRLIIGSGIFYALLAGGLMASLGPLLAWGGEEVEVSVTAEAVDFGGIYGEHIERSSIEGVELRDSLPTITLRTNGYALGGTLKGWFQTEEHGRVKLLLHADQPPFLYLYRDEGLLIYGSRDPAGTRALYQQLRGG